MGMPCSINSERPEEMACGYSRSRSRRNRPGAKAGVASMNGSWAITPDSRSNSARSPNTSGWEIRYCDSM